MKWGEFQTLPELPRSPLRKVHLIAGTVLQEINRGGMCECLLQSASRKPPWFRSQTEFSYTDNY